MRRDELQPPLSEREQRIIEAISETEFREHAPEHSTAPKVIEAEPTPQNSFDVAEKLKSALHILHQRRRLLEVAGILGIGATIRYARQLRNKHRHDDAD